MPVVFAPTPISVSFSSGETPVAPNKIYITVPTVNTPIFSPR